MPRPEDMTVKDYIYCEDCEEWCDFWQYNHDIEDAGHKGCNWRYATEWELPQCVNDCLNDRYFRCHKCMSINIPYSHETGPCVCPDCGAIITRYNVVTCNCFEEFGITEE